ncbi:MAG: DUF72 domain-containing protein [Alkalispirochaetaceae bacterium]
MPLSIGSCSWKFPSWVDIVYSSPEPASYLREYATRYRSVEIDQWFWSLFGQDAIRLPDPQDVARYLEAVDREFRFGIKAPNSVTLTHLYSRASRDAGKENPHFLSPDLMRRFLERIAPMRGQVETVMLQFEYLNKQKMGGVGELVDRLGAFFEQVPPDWPYALEVRNPNYLTASWFEFLRERGLSHVFAHGYYMPSAAETYRRFAPRIEGKTILRLLGWDRQGIEEATGKRWNSLADPRDGELDEIAAMTNDLLSRGVDVVIYVNNHFEGSAPLTIERLTSRVGSVDP